MLPTVLTVMFATTAPPAGFTGTALVPRGATAGDFADAAKAAGVAVDLGGLARSTAVPGLGSKARTFWETVDHFGTATDMRPDYVGDTGQLKFVRGAVPAGRSGSHGAFRVAARGITARRDLDTGRTNYDLEFDLAWEPKIAVFRASAEPTIRSAADDRGTAITANAAAVKAATTGFRHTAGVRLRGLSRESKSLKTITGEFHVTASPKWLPFDFTTPGPKAAEGVSVTLVSFTRVEDRWEATLDLEYPQGGPVFESFEADVWLSGNKLSLALGGKDYPPSNYELTERGRGTRAVYRFKQLPAAVSGYKLSYTTPAPPVEFAVPYTLSDIPLP